MLFINNGTVTRVSAELYLFYTAEFLLLSFLKEVHFNGNFPPYIILSNKPSGSKMDT